MRDLKKYRSSYSTKVGAKYLHVPSEKQYSEYEKNITIEVKEEDGCKVEFILKDGVLIGALMTDSLSGVVEQDLDIKNATLAYNDFDSFLNS